jgi:Ca-activated chloride channel family protein
MTVFSMGARNIIVYVIAAGLATPLLFRAQGPIEPRTSKQPNNPGVNLRADATLVLIPVEVSDHKNRPVAGLAREDFKVYDDQLEQQIVSFSMEDDPIAICLVYDVSSSVGGNTMLAWGIAHGVVQLANPGDELCVVTLASEAKLVIPLTQNENHQDVDNRLIFTKGGGSTALLDGVYLALNELRKSKRVKRAMVILSDGLDNHSRYTEGEVLKAIKESDALIYGLAEATNSRGGTSSYDDQQVLLNLAQATGGRLFPPHAAGINTVVTDLRNRYVLGFAPTNATKDGRYHRLLVKVTPPKGLPKVSANWRPGYYAPRD